MYMFKLNRHCIPPNVYLNVYAFNKKPPAAAEGLVYEQYKPMLWHILKYLKNGQTNPIL